ncbi:MAG: GNAT family N-acetyltransferase [Treponema sp.]|jgi:ribosomal protein S18 acetylase RimI-like enzyme|nr:GNAT family N-acetyltransferase [Treponema sp.]
MHFELNEVLMDAILFSMEDQNNEYLLDSEQMELVPASEIGNFAGGRDAAFSKSDVNPDAAADTAEVNNFDKSERYLNLPGWSPAEGFRLMERFAAGLRNPVVREELSAALNRGRGVFRAFKEVLGKYPETEKIWFNFKEKEMKKEILRWYNAQREIWGLELIGNEPEETADMVLEDFTFREGSGGDREAAAKLHRACGEEGLGSGNRSNGSAQIFAEMNPWVFPGDICLVAESAGKDFAAYISAVYGNFSLHICALEVKPEYRGLGLGKTLLTALLEKADFKKTLNASIDLPAGMEGFSRVLIRESFKPCALRYFLEANRKTNTVAKEDN